VNGYDSGAATFRASGEWTRSWLRPWPGVGPVTFSLGDFDKDEKRVYIKTNKGDDVDLARLEIMDLATGSTEVVESDPEKQVDFGDAVFDEQTHDVMATAYVGDRVRIYPKTERCEKDLERMRQALPAGDLAFGSSSVEPGATYLYDRQKGTFKLQYRIREKLDRKQLATMTPIRYRARDGLMIPAYLTLPKGVPAKNLPVVLSPHGGPWARDMWGYDPDIQFLANRGYAVFQPNFRASRGYGKKFLNAGNKEWARARCRTTSPTA